MKIADLIENPMENHNHNIAVDCDDTTLTYGELFARIIEFCEYLKAEGVKKGEKVAIFLNNSIEFIVAFFAINLCEAVIVPLYTNTSLNKVIGIINFYDICTVVSSKRFIGILGKLDCKNCINLRRRIDIKLDKKTHDLGCEATELFNDLNEPRKSNAEACDDTALILFSSGTTSMPKGIMLTDSNITSNVQAISEYLKVGEEDKLLLVKNISHASSITGEMLVSLYNSCTLVLTEDLPVPSLILELISKKSVTVFFAVPTILFTLMDYKYFDRYDIHTLRIINFYGASMGYAGIQSLCGRFPDTSLIYSYGLTEASPRVTYILKPDLLIRKGSSGKALQGIEVYIYGENGKSVDIGTIGEIVVKGPNVMRGYYKNKELMDKVLRDGMLFTGDLGYMDGDGYLYVTGRKDNLMIQSGKNVYPEEIESVLYNFKGVREALVRGENDMLLGHKIVAYIVPADNHLLNTREILYFCRTNLEDYKVPREIHIVSRLEKTPSGKIIRKQEIETDLLTSGC